MGTASYMAGLIVTNHPVTKKIDHYEWVGYLSIVLLAFCIYLAKLLKKVSTDL